MILPSNEGAQEEADEMFKRITAMKAFLEPG
jgi:hypothetical protein